MTEPEHISATGQGLLHTCGIRNRHSGLQPHHPGIGITLVLAVQALNWRLLSGFRDRRLGVETYIPHRAAKRAFDLLEADRTSIEAEMGEPLDWQRMDDRKASRIAVYRTDLDPRDESQRPTQYKWLLDHMQRFAQVFGNRIKDLPLEEPIEDSVAASSAEGADG